MVTQADIEEIKDEAALQADALLQEEANTPKFDRNAYHRKYMRAYMARKRAEQKSINETRAHGAPRRSLERRIPRRSRWPAPTVKG